MNIKKPCYFDSFKCAMDKCTDSCCTGLNIDIDSDTFEKYKNLDKSIQKCVKHSTIHLKDNRCPFLSENKLCNLQLNYGEDMLCQVCRSFPRFVDQYGNHRELILSLSCPEVARLILEDENVGRFVSENKDIEVDRPSEYDTKLYPHLLTARDKMFHIVLKDNLSILDKMNILYDIAEVLEENMSSPYDYTSLMFPYLDMSTYDTEKVDILHYIDLIVKVFKNYLKLDYIDNSLKDTLSSVYDFFKSLSVVVNKNSDLDEKKLKKDNLKKKYSFTIYSNTLSRIKEMFLDTTFDGYYLRLLSYFIYKHILTSCYDYRVLDKMKFCVLSTLIIKWIMVYHTILEYKVDKKLFIEVSHRYSKEVEHSLDNMDKIYHGFTKKNTYDFKKILGEVEG